MAIQVQTPAIRPTDTSAVAATTIKRSPYVAPVLDIIAQEAKQGVAARQFMFADNAKMDTYLFAYHTGKPKEANLLTAPAGGKLQVTLAMHVSGHTNQADQFARDPNERWTITVNGPTGSQSMQISPNGSANNPVYSFAQDLTIDVSKPGTYTVDAAPNGSGGVGGYIEGRRYNLHVGKENFFKPEIAPDNYRAQENVTYPYPINELENFGFQAQNG